MEGFSFIVLVVIMFSLVVFLYIYKKPKSKKDTNKKDTKTNTTRRIELRPIYGEKQKTYKRKIKTKVVGVTFDNIDGSSRQNAIGNLEIGQKVHLVWNPNDPYDSNAIMVCGDASMSHVEISSCIGHLKADLAADLVEEHAKNENSQYKGIYAEVLDVLGGTRDKPTRGCLIEIGFY